MYLLKYCIIISTVIPVNNVQCIPNLYILLSMTTDKCVIVGISCNMGCEYMSNILHVLAKVLYIINPRE